MGVARLLGIKGRGLMMGWVGGHGLLLWEEQGKLLHCWSYDASAWSSDASACSSAPPETPEIVGCQGTC